MILGIQLAGVLFGIFMAYYTFLKYKRRDLTSREYIFWMTLWALFIIISITPNILDSFTQTLHVSRTFDLLVVTGFLFVIGISFYTYTLVRESKRQIEDVVREVALRKNKK